MQRAHDEDFVLAKVDRTNNFEPLSLLLFGDAGVASLTALTSLVAVGRCRPRNQSSSARHTDRTPGHWAAAVGAIYGTRLGGIKD